MMILYKRARISNLTFFLVTKLYCADRHYYYAMMSYCFQLLNLPSNHMKLSALFVCNVLSLNSYVLYYQILKLNQITPRNIIQQLRGKLRICMRHEYNLCLCKWRNCINFYKFIASYVNMIRGISSLTKLASYKKIKIIINLIEIYSKQNSPDSFFG